MTIRSYTIERYPADHPVWPDKFHWTDKAGNHYAPYNSEDEAMDAIDRHRKSSAPA